MTMMPIQPVNLEMLRKESAAMFSIAIIAYAAITTSSDNGAKLVISLIGGVLIFLVYFTEKTYYQ